MYEHTIKTLFQSLSERWMPEHVVSVILASGVSLSHRESSLLGRAKAHYQRSSMSTTFAQADDLAKQLVVASELFGLEAPPAHDSARVRDFIDTLKILLGAKGTDFKNDRLPWQQRAQIEAPLGHRAYNKRFRLVRRMEEKYGRWEHAANMRELAQIAKSRLASFLTEEDFSADLDTAFFVAYLTAKLNKRSMFTFGKQERAYDEIAELLFQRLDEKANWYAVAHVHVSPDVLLRLSNEQEGRLLGVWYAIMIRAAKVLQECVQENNLDLQRMIVRRGNDSSTWNEAAGAFNKAREGWINLLYGLGGEDLLDRFAPGKALRLMAADVAYGHRTHGDGLEPDTAVWNYLPKPWEVLLQGALCDRATIERACAKHGVEGKGWIAPRPKTVAAFTPTPELVHGVVVSCPTLAETLKTLGYFGGPTKSGKLSGAVAIKKTMKGLTMVVDKA